MPCTRREIIQHSGRLGLYAVLTVVGLIRPGTSRAAAWNQAAFASKTLEDTFKALGATAVTQTDQIVLVAPDMTENGAVVSIGVVSKLQHTQSIAIIIEKNPTLLAAHFTLPADTLPEIQTRVKMAETSQVFALVQTEEGFAFTKKAIQVTLGSCSS